MLFKLIFRRVSIPQAVSTIAIADSSFEHYTDLKQSFNTASGKHYCNRVRSVIFMHPGFGLVSIPQAVSTIAINIRSSVFDCFYNSFNTASGKHYCNPKKQLLVKSADFANAFQYRKR